MSFEWRTDEDEGWPEEAQTAETAVSTRSLLQRRWRFLLVSLLGIVGVWLVVQWQVDERVAETTATIETELLATHNFVLQTAVNQDESLFGANLSGRNPDWSDLQKTLLADGLLLGRPMLGWQHLVSADRLVAEDVTITLDSELRAAELLYPQTYAVQTTAGLTETITLQQTAVYRQGTSRWLYAPPDEDFWGDWITQGGDYLTLVYTERDRDVAALLSIQLDRLLGQMCDELADLNCGADFQVHLRLDTDPNALLVLNEVETMLKVGLQLELPSPTLIGLPTDDAGVEMLYRAYGGQLATAVLAHQIEYDCCRHQLFFRALCDYQLDQLGLQPWPLTDEAMYQNMLDTGFDGDVTRHWSRRWEEAPPQFLQVWRIEDPDPIWQQVYMLVEFLAAQETAVSPTQMMRLMDRNSYDGWLADVLQGGANTSRLESRFLMYINDQTITGQQAEPPIPLPEGSITLICQGFEDGTSTRVYNYNLTRKTWTERFPGTFANAYVSTVDGEHFIVSEYGFADDMIEWNISLVTDEETIFLEDARYAGDNEYWLTYYLVDKTADYLVRYEYDEGEADISLLPTACAGGGCPSVPLAGQPLFSPDQAHLLVEYAPIEAAEIIPDVPQQRQNILTLTTPDGQSPQTLGRGGAPFWFNNETYGFVQMGQAGGELVTAVVDQNSPRYLLSQTELLAEMPPAERPEGLIITEIAVNPADSQEMLLQLRHEDDFNRFDPNVPTYLFKVTLTSDLSTVEQVTLLRTDFSSGVVGYGGNGRTILHGEYSNSGSAIMTWHLLNAETGQTELTFDSIGSLPSTEDGQWYLQVTDNYLLLHAPAYNYQQFIPHAFGQCQQAVLSSDE